MQDPVPLADLKTPQGGNSNRTILHCAEVQGETSQKVPRYLQSSDHHTDSYILCSKAEQRGIMTAGLLRYSVKIRLAGIGLKYWKGDFDLPFTGYGSSVRRIDDQRSLQRFSIRNHVRRELATE